MTTILATTSSFGDACSEAVDLIREAGFTLVTNPLSRKLTEAELVLLLSQHRPVGLLAGTEPITSIAINSARDFLRCISRVGVGWDNVDHEAAREANIPVFRTEGVLNDAVAELTLGFMLDALRHISRHDRDLRQGVWKKRIGGLLRARVVGIVGFGAIGQRVAELVSAFGARVIYSDTHPVASPLGEQYELLDLLRAADIVTLHASGSCCLLGRAELALLRPHTIVVNTARGGMIDETALAEALGAGRIGSVCLDVFEREPYTGPLLGMQGAVLTAHIGSYAAEARSAMELMAVQNLLGAMSKHDPCEGM
jgi:D-3-phosphoglycerate dehydrogenase